MLSATFLMKLDILKKGSLKLKAWFEKKVSLVLYYVLNQALLKFFIIFGRLFLGLLTFQLRCRDSLRSKP